MGMYVLCISSTAVALSGGSDSVALLWLAKQVFSDVTGITVDHRSVIHYPFAATPPSINDTPPSINDFLLDVDGKHCLPFIVVLYFCNSYIGRSNLKIIKHPIGILDLSA